jgi:predicted metal-dependent phosphoesterase TrpH
MCTPEMAVKYAVKRGLDGIAVADHNTNLSINEAIKHAPEGFTVVPAVEYSTNYGHMLALFCSEVCPAGRDAAGRFYLSDISVFVRENNGLLVMAHPFQTYKEIPGDVFKWVDGLEAVNSRALARDGASPQRIEILAKEHGLFTIAGSDAHLPQEIGGGYTEFPASMDLRESLKNGLCKTHGKAGNKLYWAVSRVYSKLY